MKIIEKEKDEIIEIANRIELLDYDNKEIIDFGFNSIEELLLSKSNFDKYFIVKNKNNIYSIFCVERNGVINLFFTKKCNYRNIVKILIMLKKRLLQAKDCKVFFINVSSWYKPAIRNLKKIGFKILRREEFYSVFYIEV